MTRGEMVEKATWDRRLLARAIVWRSSNNPKSLEIGREAAGMP